MRELISVLCLLSISALPALAQGIPKPPADQLVVRPKEIDGVLNNPGIGFHTFQRFNGDALNPGIRWTEGHPIEYQEFDGDLTNPDHPAKVPDVVGILRVRAPLVGGQLWPGANQTAVPGRHVFVLTPAIRGDPQA